MKQVILFAWIAVVAASCGGDTPQNSGEKFNPSKEKTAEGNPSYDPKRGTGKFTDVAISPTLDAAKAANGEKVYGVKCSSCHKLTGEKLVGPGWSGVTTKRTASWILNFMTNTDEMLDKDPEAQAQLEICLVRMPNQNLSDDDAFALYEFMRQNDGVK
ncbi:MAG: hypothetical protein RL220_561 [Bacteroidota bacterium]|jgi:cytochrome c5